MSAVVTEDRRSPSLEDGEVVENDSPDVVDGIVNHGVSSFSPCVDTLIRLKLDMSPHLLKIKR